MPNAKDVVGSVATKSSFDVLKRIVYELNALPDSDTIAEFLAQAGIHGNRCKDAGKVVWSNPHPTDRPAKAADMIGDVGKCPVANYLYKVTGRTVQVSVFILDTESREVIFPSNTLRDFICNFDNGMYPDLVSGLH